VPALVKASRSPDWPVAALAIPNHLAELVGPFAVAAAIWPRSSRAFGFVFSLLRAPAVLLASQRRETAWDRELSLRGNGSRFQSSSSRIFVPPLELDPGLVRTIRTANRCW